MIAQRIGILRLRGLIMSNNWTPEIGPIGTMTGADLTAWRKTNGYTQELLMKELEVKSRQTISSWEHSDRIPRMVELALRALEYIPEYRQIGGKKATSKEAKAYFAREAT
jgi:DNA-binding XRE family transcriptional regulator